MGALIPIALTVAPEIARWLFGESGEKTTAAVGKAITEATGTSDAEAAMAVLQQSPSIAAQLRMQLAQMAAELEQASRSNDLAEISATMRDVADARAQMVMLNSQKTAIAWSAPIISGIVLLTFVIVMALVLTHGMPAGSETAANLLLGTLAAMATSVVSYWVGSSAGSARKDERLAQISK